MANHKLTIQRLTDLAEVSQNAEVKLLSKIMRDYVELELKTDLGFRAEIDKKEPAR